MSSNFGNDFHVGRKVRCDARISFPKVNRLEMLFGDLPSSDDLILPLGVAARVFSRRSPEIQPGTRLTASLSF